MKERYIVVRDPDSREYVIVDTELKQMVEVRDGQYLIPSYETAQEVAERLNEILTD